LQGFATPRSVPQGNFDESLPDLLAALSSEHKSLLADAYNEFSNLVKKQLHSLITSKIHVLHHAFLAGPDFPNQEALQQVLLSMNEDPKTPKILQSLEIEKWQAMDREETKFLIDLMDTLSPE